MINFVNNDHETCIGSILCRGRSKDAGLEKMRGSTNPALKNILTGVIGIHENADVFIKKEVNLVNEYSRNRHIL